MRITIIGAGLGGLECGYLLAKQGFEVTVLEQNARIGGCLQSFFRKGKRFDTGFHYVGGLGEGELLHQLFEQLNLLHLPWYQLDKDCFDEVVWNDRHYRFANGYDQFVDELSSSFPEHRAELAQYVRFLKDSQTSFADLASDGSKAAELLAKPAYQFLKQTFSNEVLRDVVAATSLKMELRADSLPLYIYAQINGSFIQSAWRLRGGGQQIADSLADDIRSFGGKVLTNKCVTEILADNDKISCVRCADGDEIPCDFLIADIHPAVLLPMLPDGLVRKRYQQRICALPNSFGMFTVNLALRPGSVGYRNRNLFIHSGADLWRTRPEDDHIRSVGVHFAVPESGGQHTDNIDIFFPMLWSEVAQWRSTEVGRRGNDYESFKQRKADEAIRLVSSHIPDLQNNIQDIYTSSPLTYRDYTGTFEGSAYGIRKDCEHLMTTMIPVKTPVSNLLFTGQNVNFHGVLGVTITALLTVRQFCSILQ